MDPELVAMARQLVRTDLNDPQRARANNRARRAAEVLPDEWSRVEVTDRILPGGVPVRLYRPPGSAPLPAVVWLHGGSFVLGDLDSSDGLCARIAATVVAVVVSVGYRLAPEHPCPAALRDACAALDWVASEARKLNVDPARIAIAGTSAGACLAAGASLLARDRGRLRPACHLLTYPALDDRCRTASAREFTDTPVITSESITLMWKIYLAGGAANAYVAPGRAADLSGMPPALIVVAEQDPLRDEAIDYATRLRESGVDVVLYDVPGTFHGFDTIAPEAAVSRRTRESYLGALAERLRSP